MQTTPLFRGVATAIVTPFTASGREIDYPAFAKLIDRQIECGIDALVIAGTTGECSTLTDTEHRELITYAIKHINRRVPVIAGVGSNDTAYAVELAVFAAQAGADMLLISTPYYNKTTQDGLIAHYSAIAAATPLPIMLYNVPHRTGMTIEPATYARLAELDTVTCIKEANGDMSKIVETFAFVGKKLDIYTGNDDQVVPTMSMGGIGVVSVISNVAPVQVKRMVDAALSGDYATAAEIQCELIPLCNSLFGQVSPIPTKAALSKLGLCENVLRLPLVAMEIN